jgi:hypothetical protein
MVSEMTGRSAGILAAGLVFACSNSAGEDDRLVGAGGASDIGGEAGSHDRGAAAAEPNGGADSQGGNSGAGGEAADAQAGSTGDPISNAGAAGASQAGQGGADPAPPLRCHDGSKGEGATCESLCSAWFPICKTHVATANIYADEADCLVKCGALAEEQLCCRGYHVTNAPNNPNTHCAHAAGFRTCP